MIYKSNLSSPDLTRHFKHLTVRPMGHSFGHDVPSDWSDKQDDDPVFGIYKRCGLWTHDEAAIMYNCVAALDDGARTKFWCDIGAHTGWTSAHLAAHQRTSVDCVEPMLAVQGFQDRFEENTAHCWFRISECFAKYSDAFFERNEMFYDGYVIDGCHEPGQPERDALNAARLSPKLLQSVSVVLFHDFVGEPVRNAVQLLMQQGFKARVYFTPHMVACCWRGDFVPPDHVPDPNLPDLKARCPEFPFERCL